MVLRVKFVVIEEAFELYACMRARPEMHYYYYYACGILLEVLIEGSAVWFLSKKPHS